MPPLLAITLSPKYQFSPLSSLPNHLFPSPDVAEPVAHYRLHPFERFGAGAVAGAERAWIFAEAARDLFVFDEILCAVAVFLEKMEAAYHRLRKVLSSELADRLVEDVQDSRMWPDSDSRLRELIVEEPTSCPCRYTHTIRPGLETPPC